MEITDFFQYPQYFSIFMIWASGYIFVYSIFRKSRAWKEFDSTIKVVVGLLAGFAIEFCLVLPVFYLENISNLNSPLLFPAFNATWYYNWLITGFVATLFAKTKDRERLLKYVHFAFARLLYFIFMGLFLLLSILLFEYVLVYPRYIWTSSSIFVLYLFINWVFASLGMVFCGFFQFFTEAIYEEEKIYGGLGYVFIRKHRSDLNRRFSYYMNKVSKEIKRFLKSRWKYVPILTGVVIAASIIPLDSRFSFLTPRVNYYANVADPEGLVFVSLGANFLGYNLKPLVYGNFSRTVCDNYTVVSSNYDRFGVLLISLPPQCTGQAVKTGYFRQTYTQPQDLWAISDYSLKDNLSLTAVPSASNASELQITYEQMIGHSFNVTLIYWENIVNDSLLILPSESEGVYFNATYDRWTQEFQIINNSNESIYLYEIQYDRFNFEVTNKDTVEVSWNGNKIEPIKVFADLAKFSPLEIKQHENGTLLVNFLSTEKFPR